MTAIDHVLRAEGKYAVGGESVPWRRLLLLTASFAFVYGAVMGMYGSRVLQACFSGIKVPLLLGVSTLICIPSFYVINSLLGLRRDFAAAFRGVLSAQATLALTLASLAPVTVVAYASMESYPLAILFNGGMFAVSTVAGQHALNRHYAPLVQKNRRHRVGKLAWLSLYVFVAVQMAWVLRPFVGAPDLPVHFVREDAWSNAYVEVYEILMDALR